MPSRFDNRQMKTVVISPSGVVRSLLSTVLRELGFQNISSVPDIKACLEIMETERVYWVISPTQDHENGNVLQLLDVVSKHPLLRAVKISILRDGEDSVIPQAFSMGCFSCHAVETSKEACLLEFQRLLQKIDTYAGDYARVAADYLRDFLFEKNEYQELKRLFKSMLQIYPGNYDLMMDLGKTLLQAGEVSEGRVLLQQIMLLSPERKAEVQELSDTYLQGSPVVDGAAHFLAEHFGFNSCLVLDSDPAAIHFIKSLLETMGFKEISTHRDPISALKWLRSNPKPNLVISEWTLPHIPGPVFLYKVRNRLDLDVPLIVISDAIKERETFWLNELGASRLVNKPIEQSQLFEAVLWIMQQQAGASDLHSLKLKLKVLSKQRDFSELPRVRHLFMNHPALIEGDRLLMEAQLAYDSSCYLHAKKYAMDALKAGANSQEALELLGKSLMQLREFDAALRCLENVSFLSPFNVAHLCQIAECHLERGDDANFERLLDQARSMDHDATVVLETEAKGALKRGHLETSRKLLQRLKSFKEVLGFMNNRAVSLMRVGNHEEALELYQRALASLPDGQSEARSLLYYNLGLGYARISRLEDSLHALEQAEATRNPQRQKKINSLKNRVFVALQTGEPLQLHQDTPTTEPEEHEKLLKLIEQASDDERALNRSDFCLHKIYNTLIDNARVQEFLSKPTLFTPRGKLVKDPLRGLTHEAS